MASRMKVLLLGGLAVAAGTVAYLKRERITSLLPSGGQEPAAAPPPPPAPSNYDAPGPVANTATPVPAPEPQVQPAGFDEQAEVDAAAAEAANIGGEPCAYTGPEGEPATEAERPLAEAGEGVAEGQEQAEADLAENAVLRDAGESGAQAQIDEAIEQQHNPLAGETAEPIVSEEPSEQPTEEQPAIEEPPPAAESPAEEQPAPPEDTPAAEQAPPPQEEDGGWKTWSGRAVDS